MNFHKNIPAQYCTVNQGVQGQLGMPCKFISFFFSANQCGARRQHFSRLSFQLILYPSLEGLLSTLAPIMQGCGTYRVFLVHLLSAVTRIRIQSHSKLFALSIISAYGLGSERHKITTFSKNTSKGYSQTEIESVGTCFS